MTDWRDDAECRVEDPEMFFPTGSETAAQDRIRQAKAVCARCPVTAECLTWALEMGLDNGVFGGFSADDRRALRLALFAPAPAGTS